MIEKVAAYMEQHHMVKKGDHLCLGVSGGADSVCLFRILEHLRHEMEFTMSVVHIEHGLRGEESLIDMEFVRSLAEAYNISFCAYAYPVAEIAKERGLSLEEAGRNLRYEAFVQETKKYVKEAALCGGTVKIALAHHGDDNAETMLFHLCRGSGIEGLVGIRPVRENIIRPLLGVTRSEIEKFLREEGQDYRTDATNADVVYSRNRIRNRVMPELVLINEQTVSHMNSLSEDVLELSAYLGNEVDKILSNHMIKSSSGEVVFELVGFEGYPTFLKRRVMLELIAKVSGSRMDIGREHTKALLELAEGRVGRQVSLPYGIVAVKEYDKLQICLVKEKSEIGDKSAKNSNVFLEIPLGVSEGKIRFSNGVFCYRVFQMRKKDVKIPKNQYTKWFDYDKIKNGLHFRNRAPGDYFVVDTKGHRQKLKAYWINEKVPRTKREEILLLAEGSHILWAIGYRISEYYKVSEDTKRVLEVKFMEDEA